MRMSHSTSAGPDMLLRSSEPSSQFSTPGNGPLGTLGRDMLSERVFAAADTMSRRMQDLAREFDCLGYFDDDEGPRAA